MLKNILNLKGTQILTQKEQLEIAGAAKTVPICGQPPIHCRVEGRYYDPCAPISPDNWPCDFS